MARSSAQEGLQARESKALTRFSYFPMSIQTGAFCFLRSAKINLQRKSSSSTSLEMDYSDKTERQFQEADLIAPSWF